MLSRLIIVFLSRSKHLLISWLQSPSAVFLEPSKVVSHCFHCFPIYLPWSNGPDAIILVFWMLSFKPTFSLSSFTLIKRLFSSPLLSAIRMMSSAYLRLLIFLPEILIPSCASCSPFTHSSLILLKCKSDFTYSLWLQHFNNSYYCQIKYYILFKRMFNLYKISGHSSELEVHYWANHSTFLYKIYILRRKTETSQIQKLKYNC